MPTEAELVEQLRHAEAEVRRAAALALGTMSGLDEQRAPGPLRSLLDDPAEEVRWAAAFALLVRGWSRAGERRLLPALFDRFETPSSRPRLGPVLVRVAREAGDPLAAVAPLSQVLLSEYVPEARSDDARAREEALAHISGLCKQGFDIAAAVPALRGLLGDAALARGARKVLGWAHNRSTRRCAATKSGMAPPGPSTSVNAAGDSCGISHDWSLDDRWEIHAVQHSDYDSSRTSWAVLHAATRTCIAEFRGETDDTAGGPSTDGFFKVEFSPDDRFVEATEWSGGVTRVELVPPEGGE